MEEKKNVLFCIVNGGILTARPTSAKVVKLHEILTESPCRQRVVALVACFEHIRRRPVEVICSGLQDVLKTPPPVCEYSAANAVVIPENPRPSQGGLPPRSPRNWTY